LVPPGLLHHSLIFKPIFSEKERKPMPSIKSGTARQTKSVTRKASKAVPAVELLAPECPPELGPVARTEWHRIVPELASLNLIAHLDRGQLAIYCVAFAQWLEAAEFIQKFGSMVKTPNGFPVQSPYVAILNRQADTMIRIASEFGFTPASRAKLGFPKSTCDLESWPL
jgi:P27 family predicted phage terminase small subunit